MARQFKHKTELGQRLATAREHFGLDRAAFSDALQAVSASALANYERGDNVPDASVLQAYFEKFGVSPLWLVAGIGDMLTTATHLSSIAGHEARQPHFPGENTGSVQPFDVAVMARLGAAVDLACSNSGRVISISRRDEEAAKLYRDLTTRLRDFTDADFVAATIAVLRKRLEDRLAQLG